MTDLIDIGINLAHDAFDSDRDEVMDRAAAVGVGRMIVTGTTVSATARAVELASAAPGKLFATAGIHPHHASESDPDSIHALAALAEDPLVVAIGECGLDYFRNFSPPAAQRRTFEAQLELARASGLPVFLHQRDAHVDFVEILERHCSDLKGGVAHCFTGGVDELEAYLDLGLHIGVTGWVCDERRGQALRAALPHIPLDRLLLETDAPYLLPRDLQPKPKSRRNEPAFLGHIAASVAAIMEQPLTEVTAAALRNTEKLFGLPPAPERERKREPGEFSRA